MTGDMNKISLEKTIKTGKGTHWRRNDRNRTKPDIMSWKIKENQIIVDRRDAKADQKIIGGGVRRDGEKELSRVWVR